MNINIVDDRQDNTGKILLYENNVLAGSMIYNLQSPNILVIIHTEVDSKFAGKSYGKKLVLKAVNLARSENFKIKPLCTYAHKILNQDSSLSDVLT